MRDGGSLWPSTKICLVCSCSSRKFSSCLAELGRGTETLERVLKIGVGRKGKATKGVPGVRSKTVGSRARGEPWEDRHDSAELARIINKIGS